mmetsp:Transcript_30706/g.68016  ORF Transcript_30706/g.68016 Transcript_30706/m.68016 type:complete len:433 (-) Transcript_30706:347-1645(-)
MVVNALNHLHLLIQDLEELDGTGCAEIAVWGCLGFVLQVHIQDVDVPARHRLVHAVDVALNQHVKTRLARGICVGPRGQPHHLLVNTQATQSLHVLAHKFHELQAALGGQRLSALPHCVNYARHVDVVHLEQNVKDVVGWGEAVSHVVVYVGEVQLHAVQLVQQLLQELVLIKQLLLIKLQPPQLLLVQHLLLLAQQRLALDVDEVVEEVAPLLQDVVALAVDLDQLVGVPCCLRHFLQLHKLLVHPGLQPEEELVTEALGPLCVHLGPLVLLIQALLQLHHLHTADQYGGVRLGQLVKVVHIGPQPLFKLAHSHFDLVKVLVHAAHVVLVCLDVPVPGCLGVLCRALQHRERLKRTEQVGGVLQQLEHHLGPLGQHHDVLNLGQHLLDVGVREAEHADLVLVVDQAGALLTQRVDLVEAPPQLLRVLVGSL